MVPLQSDKPFCLEAPDLGGGGMCRLAAGQVGDFMAGL